MGKSVWTIFMHASAMYGQLTKAHPDDAGYDIRTSETATIQPGERVSLRTGARLSLPPNTVGIIKGRSGMAIMHDIECCNAGVIDEGYRGEILVKLHNFGKEPYTVKAGDRVAQLLILPLVISEVVRVDELPPSHTRGENGFGSSGH